MTEIPYLERVKIQSEILLPLFRLLRSELGSDKSNELLRTAVQEYAVSLGEQISKTSEGSSIEKLQSFFPVFTANDALEFDPIVSNSEELSINVTKCKYAEYFASIDESEFGTMITCAIDPPMTAGIGSDLKLNRTQTISTGGEHCDFRWSSTK